MIIGFPTGLYRIILPQQASDPGNITWTISSQDPPRSDEDFQELPLAEAIRPKVPINPNDEDRRGSFGELIFTVAESAQTIPGSAKKAFEVGDILGFETEELDAEFSQPLTAVEVRHDTNLLDLSSLGLDPAEINDIIGKSLKKQEEILVTLNEQISVVENTKVRIRENQKDINETQKTIDAVAVVEGSGSSVLDKLDTRLEELRAEREALIAVLGVSQQAVKDTRDDLLAVSQLVR